MRQQGLRRVGDGACLLKLEEREVRSAVNGNTGGPYSVRKRKQAHDIWRFDWILGQHDEGRLCLTGIFVAGNAKGFNHVRSRSEVAYFFKPSGQDVVMKRASNIKIPSNLLSRQPFTALFVCPKHQCETHTACTVSFNHMLMWLLFQTHRKKKIKRGNFELLWKNWT